MNEQNRETHRMALKPSDGEELAIEKPIGWPQKTGRMARRTYDWEHNHQMGNKEETHRMASKPSDGEELAIEKSIGWPQKTGRMARKPSDREKGHPMGIPL